ncbi:MAG: right-handed parallel beta-helix repeat-containing protein, partial [Actinomycetota bacterium]|nr:right-handed parallel beta-helix repeat-containing protein [Actinomycetota bacterium]
MTVRNSTTHVVGTTIVGMALIVSGCTASESPTDLAPDAQAPIPQQPVDPPPSGQAGPLPPDCTSTVTQPQLAAAVLARLQPGSTMCVSGDRLADAQLQVTTSGRPGQPITIVSDGATVRSMNVRADHVVIQGLRFAEGNGLTMAGRGLVARNNVIYNAAEDGLACLECVETIIESNTVQRADGTGIYLAGEQITARGNTISESIPRTQGDADGIRFFGSGHRLMGNTIKDIKAGGYRDEGPHTDCFQTYNTAEDPPTYDVIIADNVCTNVDVQCLIATANERGAQDAPAGRTAIIFEGNTCEVNGSQAV